MPPDPGNTASQAISADSLTKKFGRREVLHGVSFGIEKGSVFGVIGPNGAGKTTVMRCLLDIIRPTAGTSTVLGENPRTAGPALRRRIGYLPGELFLEGRITGRKLLSHYADISGPVRPGRVDALAERLGLDLDRHTRKLSKGNKQKLGLVQAFMHDPELLVLDEPTSGLDPLVQQEFLTMVREAQANGQTVFLSSHVLSEVQQAADTVAILRDGRIITVATVDSLREGAVRHVRFTAAGISASDAGALLAGVPGIGHLEVLPAGDGVELSATLGGAIQPLLRVLASLTLTELVLEEPDLEESVLELYGTIRGNGNGNGNGGTERRTDAAGGGDTAHEQTVAAVHAGVRGLLALHARVGGGARRRDLHLPAALPLDRRKPGHAASDGFLPAGDDQGPQLRPDHVGTGLHPGHHVRADRLHADDHRLGVVGSRGGGRG